MASPTIVAGVRQALAAHAPFAHMRAEDLEFLAQRVELAYFGHGEDIVGPDSGVPQRLWIIKQGAVETRVPGRETQEPSAVLTVGESFPLGALLADRPASTAFRASGDVFCWTLEKRDFDQLVARSEVFLDFSKRRLAAMLDLSNRALQASYSQQATQWRSMASPLGDLVRREPVQVSPDASLRDVFTTLEREAVGSVIVGDAEGIFTRQDVIGRVSLPGLPLETPICEVMTSPLLTLEASATVAEAMLMMAHRRIRHIPVRRDGVLVGVITERDLFVMQRQTLRGIGDAIAAARTVPAMARVAADIRDWSSVLVAQGVAAAFVTRLISRLNDQLTVRLIQIESTRTGLTLDGACWLALGSEGREEQTIATDQDNGLILPDDVDEAAREHGLSLARAVNEALDACGYPLCKGGIMASNPRWCLTRSQWHALFDGWIDRGDPESLLAANIFFDFRPIDGDSSLAAGLRAHITQRAAGNARFLKQMSDNAQRNRPPASWTGGVIGQWFTTESAEVDLKLHGTAPFVDGARLLALAHRVAATGTAERLQALADAGALPAEETRAWTDAFQFLQSLRLRVQHIRRDADAHPNLLDTATLSDIDRRILKEAFRQARKLQQRLAVDYPG